MQKHMENKYITDKWTKSLIIHILKKTIRKHVVIINTQPDTSSEKHTVKNNTK